MIWRHNICSRWCRCEPLQAVGILAFQWSPTLPCFLTRRNLLGMMRGLNLSLTAWTSPSSTTSSMALELTRSSISVFLASSKGRFSTLVSFFSFSSFPLCLSGRPRGTLPRRSSGQSSSHSFRHLTALTSRTPAMTDSSSCRPIQSSDSLLRRRRLLTCLVLELALPGSGGGSKGIPGSG